MEGLGLKYKALGFGPWFCSIRRCSGLSSKRSDSSKASRRSNWYRGFGKQPLKSSALSTFPRSSLTGVDRVFRQFDGGQQIVGELLLTQFERNFL